MFELFKTVLWLSGIGSALVILLLLLKPLTVKRFPAKWQSAVWLLVTLSMLVPFWKFVPRQVPEQLAPRPSAVLPQQHTAFENQDKPETVIAEETPMEYREISISKTVGIRVYDFIAYLWLGGACLFLLSAAISYSLFLIKKRKDSVDLAGNEALCTAKQALHIKRRIRVRRSEDIASPMLVGVLFPVIYMPETSLGEEAEKMIYRHELTHYKHRDLLFKWLCLFVNALHWFNPLAYLLSRNVSQACEVSCDMSVIKDLNEEEQALYMHTILDLLKKNK